MGSRGNAMNPVESEALKILHARFVNAGWTVQELADRSGLGKTTAFKSIKGERATTISDFEKLCKAFNLRAWKVLKTAQERVAARVLLEPTLKAEDSIRTPAPVATDPATYAKQAEAKLARLLQSNYTAAAKHHTPDPYDRVGEENQDETSKE
ncbi:helix-turn-helix domain-containing protein [Trueperella pyogenes]|uniref:helix-turn-helix domain-containing protein n=2 Tax=Trueperella pyogenes TaxID=1661 RepID=UPI000E0CEA61|nr:helix-turn-helix transcriptional regulator [Trueperella pyogenes]